METRLPSFGESPESQDQNLNQVPETGTCENENKQTAPATDGAETDVIETMTGSDADPEAAAEAVMTEGERHTERHADLTKDEVIAMAEELASRDAADIRREEVARLRKFFSDISTAEIAAMRAEYEANAPEGAEPFEAPADEAEEKLRSLLASIKTKKQDWLAAQETLRAENLAAKQAVLDEILALAADTDNVNRTYPRFQELRQKFLEIGEVTPSAETEIQRAFKDAQERYYDQLKVNKDLRDYDFRKNLDLKLLLIDEARKLMAETDVIAAFRRLQELHAKWREAGPVAKEKREEIWSQFKDISAEINKRYQAYFEERKAQEQRNEEGKTALCERIEALDFSGIRNFAGWEDMTKIIIAVQEEWKKLGFASKKMNNALFARFRATCDKFFAAKAEFFKSTKETLSANLAKKIALCERAEALRESTDWKKTTDELVELQKQWKTIGAVPKKHSDSIWHRFLSACDAFFDNKKKATTGVRQEQNANLKAKREVIDALKAIAPDTPRDKAVAQVRELQNRWNSIGHVPYRDKDKVYDAYRAAVNELTERFDLRGARQSMAGFEANISDMAGDENKLYRERERLMRTLEQKRNELHTIENNMGFFNSKSKAGEQMMRELQGRVQRVKDDLATLEKKIAIIDNKL